MRYLGIDPGTTTIGYGIVEQVSSGFKCLDYGIISNPGKDSSADKINTVDAISKLIAEYKPKRATVERLFFFKNKKSVMAVSEMRGVIMLALRQSNTPVIELTPLQIKQRICGHGRAEKHQIQKMVRLLLGMDHDIKPDDAADALAMALCAATAPEEY